MEVGRSSHYLQSLLHPRWCFFWVSEASTLISIEHTPPCAANRYQIHSQKVPFENNFKKESSLKCVYNKKHALTHPFNRNFPKKNISHMNPLKPAVPSLFVGNVVEYDKQKNLSKATVLVVFEALPVHVARYAQIPNLRRETRRRVFVLYLSCHICGKFQPGEV